MTAPPVHRSGKQLMGLGPASVHRAPAWTLAFVYARLKLWANVDASQEQRIACLRPARDWCVPGRPPATRGRLGQRRQLADGDSLAQAPESHRHPPCQQPHRRAPFPPASCLIHPQLTTAMSWLTASASVVLRAAGEGIAEVVKLVRIERRGRDVYIIGAANVGKSAFVRCGHTDSPSGVPVQAAAPSGPVNRSLCSCAGRS